MITYRRKSSTLCSNSGRKGCTYLTRGGHSIYSLLYWFGEGCGFGSLSGHGAYYSELSFLGVIEGSLTRSYISNEGERVPLLSLL